MWTDGVGWRQGQILPFVTADTRLKLAAMVVDNVTGATDKLSWGGSNDGSFTVTSSYSNLTWSSEPRPAMEKLFGKVWKSEVSERVRIFLWLVVHQVLMTNSERWRRHLCDNNICTVCKRGEETILHMLRDCPAMSGLWSRLVPLRKRREFFDCTLLEWVYWNLNETIVLDDVPWPIYFCMGAWWGWKWRCGNVFGENHKCRDRVRYIRDLVKEVNRAQVMEGGGGSNTSRVERLVSWRPPSMGWVKLNTDGASHGNPGRATAGGVLRDGDGRWIQGFTFNIGVCSAPLTELWGVLWAVFSLGTADSTVGVRGGLGDSGGFLDKGYK